MPPEKPQRIHDLPDLDPDPTVPLYRKIAAILTGLIQEGTLQPGDLLPSELALCRRYEVSRTTVRQALALLVEENLAIRQQGKGSIVGEKKLSRKLSHLYSFTEDMKALGLNPHSRVLQQGITTPPSPVAAALRLESNEEAFRLQRLRMVSDEAILLENTYVPHSLIREPDIGKLDFAKDSLYASLRQTYGLRLERAVETYEAIFLEPEWARLLQCQEGRPAFRIRRVAYLENEKPFEWTEAIARGDKCLFQVDLQTRQKKIGFSRQITP